MAANIGLNGKLYVDEAGATATTEFTKVKDVSIQDERSSADISTRSEKYECFKGTTRKVSVEFQMLWDEDDDQFSVILDAFVNNTPLAVKALDKTSGKGVDFDGLVTKCTANQALKDAVLADIVIKPTYITRYPQSV